MVQVTLGMHRWGEGETYRALELLIHEPYDIGLVRLDREAGPRYRPICLAGPDTILRPGERLLATGGTAVHCRTERACRLGLLRCLQQDDGLGAADGVAAPHLQAGV